MSTVLEERVMAAHPLTPAHRMVLFMVARGIPDGQTEALVNRTTLARSLDARPDAISHALTAGEQLDLCRVLKNGRIAFTAYDGLLGAPPPVPTNGNGIREAPPILEQQIVDNPTTAKVMAEFATQWQLAYKQKYIFVSGKDHKIAKTLANALTTADLPRRVTNYLQHPDAFYGECMHSFSIFARDINKFGLAQRPTSTRTNVPDAAATRRYMDSLREPPR